MLLFKEDIISFQQIQWFANATDIINAKVCENVSVSLLRLQTQTAGVTWEKHTHLSLS